MASLQRALKLRDSADIKNMVTALNGLMKESFIHQNEQEQYSLGAPKAVIVGTFRGNDKGFGFVSVDDSTDPDVFIAPPNTKHAIDGDTVEINILHPAKPGDPRGADGEVTKVTGHKYTSLVGEFQPFSDKEARQTGFIGTVTSPEKKIHKYPIMVRIRECIPKPGTW